MPTTQAWVDWAKGLTRRKFGRDIAHTNRRAYIVHCQRCTRVLRDDVPLVTGEQGSWSRVNELGNANHYFFTRRFVCEIFGSSVREAYFPTENFPWIPYTAFFRSQAIEVHSAFVSVANRAGWRIPPLVEKIAEAPRLISATFGGLAGTAVMGFLIAAYSTIKLDLHMGGGGSLDSALAVALADGFQSSPWDSSETSVEQRRWELAGLADAWLYDWRFASRWANLASCGEIPKSREYFEPLPEGAAPY